MARALFIKDDAFVWMTGELRKVYPDISETVLKVGADIIADEMKSNLEGILSPWATGQLVAAFGITPVKRDRKYNYNLHLGFDGYQYLPSGDRVPFQLLARTFESGAVYGSRFEYGLDGERFKLKKKPVDQLTFWREPTPFAAPAVRKKRGQAVQVMKETAEREYQKIISESRNHK